MGAIAERCFPDRARSSAPVVHPDYPGSYGRRTVVADFSRILAGPYAIMLLADMGAEVIKVEGPAGDDTRTWMPPVRDKVSTYFLGINRGKRSIALDLRSLSRGRYVVAIQLSVAGRPRGCSSRELQIVAR